IRKLLKNIQSVSRRVSKERSRSSPGLARDYDDRRTDARRFKWFGILDRLRSPATSQQQDHEPGVKPTSPASVAKPITAAPKETFAPPGGTEAGPHDTALSETSQSIEKDLDFERYGADTSERRKKQSAPFADSAPELAPPVTGPTISVEDGSIAPPSPPATS